jgi:chromosomal replication initiator protein
MNPQDFNINKVWDAVLQSVRLVVSEGTFNTYLKPTYLAEIKDGGERMICEVNCPSAFIKNTVEQRYWGQINEELNRVLGKPAELVLKIKAGKKETKPEEIGPLFSDNKKIIEEKIKRANLRMDLTFESYAVGGSNQMAFAAAQAVARKPGEAYNPLFIYGGVGVGKTHLMQAIGHVVLDKIGGGVLFCSGEEFTNDLVEAIRFKSTEKVRAKYRRLKLLMIDDIQFIAGKTSVQEEFFHTFNSIQRDGGQIVMTSDKPPAEISKLEERLRSRFGAGLIVDIGQPDFELRTAILLIKAKQKNFNLDMEIAQLIAENVEGVRELQGFLTRLITEREMNGRSVTRERVEEILKVNRPAQDIARVVTPAEVIAAVSNFYRVGPQQLKGERRTKTVAWPRQILMYLLRMELRLPLEEVGRLIGGRDHTTILHGSDKVKAELEKNPQLKSEINEIKRKFLAPAGA